MKTGRAARVAWLVLIFATMLSSAGQACTDPAGKRVTERTAGEHRGPGDLNAIGDFDGDGSVDEAFFVRSSGVFSVMACLERGNRPVRLFNLRGGIGNKGIRAASPGRYTAACAKGHGPPCRAGEPAELVLRQDAIEFFTYESASVLLYWNEGSFGQFWLSD